MKNKIITIIALISLIITIILMAIGISIGPIKISSIKDLIQKNKEVSNSIEEVSKLTSIDYAACIQEFEDNSKELENKKEKYYELVNLSSESSNNVYESEEYDIEYLWTIIGKYATERNLVLGMNVVKAGEYYDLDFTLKGTYKSISKFITLIENDSELQFRIYNFKLVPGVKLAGGREVEDTKNLLATFSVKDISLNEEKLSNVNKNNKKDENKANPENQLEQETNTVE